MAKGKPGADSLPPVTHQINGKNLVDQAISFFGKTPVFWGRYFKQKTTTSTDEYHTAENHLLGSNDIRLLPIGRQTTHVDAGKKTGTQDGRDNAEAVLSVFGVDYLASKATKFLMFLDVEGGNHRLSSDYYTGWAGAVTDRSLELSNEKVEILPAVYATQGDTPTWKAIVKSGMPCAGAWVARWPKSGCVALPDWSKFKPPTVAIPCDVLIWQYSDDCLGGSGFDCNEVNPNIDLNKDLLAKLIPVPA
jgi:hypothetical protein